ncbi:MULTISPECIES: ATP-binding protein [unclassified Sedimentibacter]|uniref:ATP-binding protein n=1 Tax=unclassified Sedimentibacter TaxID=2649220 RepID=UPI0027E19348|nr:sensor histidine kinase [Sedimentibacter sp. MB35-C1]WMJ77224.1 sensor histidine kinase [Sedimentibacter sp. MB35-C1]
MKMKLGTQITIFFVIILIFSLGSMTFLSYHQMRIILTDELEEKLMNIAVYASEDYMVIDCLDGYENFTNEELNEHIEEIRSETNVDFITVFGMDRLRLTHPVKEKIGKEFEGGDEGRVLTEPSRYISSAVGSLGKSLRAFSPVYKDGIQVGAVCVGSTLVEINKETFAKTEQFVPFILIGLVLGICCAYILTTNIKYEILGMEPREITLLLKQNDAILENVKEGIITLDEKGNLIQFNKEAAKILGLTRKDMNRNINVFINLEDTNRLMNDENNIEDFEVKIRPGVTVLCKYNVLKDDKNHIIGQVINFRDLTAVKRIAEELTGIQKMAWSLRAQNHEFMNKLHTISGLIQLEEYDEAIKYISNASSRGNDVTSTITGRIKNINIAAILLAKYYKAEELRIKLEIDKSSFLNKVPEHLNDDDLSSVIGNLIENSLDAVSVDGTGKILFKMSEDDDRVIIDIKDNGPGVPEDIKEKIYERNFSTKSGQRGFGLYIVKNIIENANGEITLSTDKGTSWHIEIPTKDGDEND